MHMISRRANEGVVIGREIQVTVLEIGKNWVDIEIQSKDNGDSRVVRLWLPKELARENHAEELESVLN